MDFEMIVIIFLSLFCLFIVKTITKKKITKSKKKSVTAPSAQNIKTISSVPITQKKTFEEEFGSHHCDGRQCNPYEECNDYERLLCRTIIQQANIPKDRIYGQYLTKLPSGLARVDFAMKTFDNRAIAIEFDGYEYHAKLDRKNFNRQLQRQNELVASGWTILRFTFYQITQEQDSCINLIKSVFYNKTNEFSPIDVPVIFACYRKKDKDNIRDEDKEKFVYSKIKNMWNTICNNVNNFDQETREFLTFSVKCSNPGCDGKAERSKTPGKHGFYWHCKDCNSFYSDMDGVPKLQQAAKTVYRTVYSNKATKMSIEQE